MKLLMTPEFIAEVESIWQAGKWSRLEYQRHPFANTTHGPSCAAKGCPIALRRVERDAARMRAKRGAA